MNLKLTKEQEQALINIGLNTLLSPKVEKPRTIKAIKKAVKKQRWSKERHAKYAATMAKKWGHLRNKKAAQ